MIGFRSIGRAANIVIGGTAKNGVKVISEVVSRKNVGIGSYIDDLGNSVIEASKQAVDSVGQFADGTVQGAYGIIKKNSYHQEKGWENIKDSTGRTIKGIGSSIKYTARSTVITLSGIRNNNRQEILQGVGNLGKVVAVSSFAIGIFDIIEGPDLAQAEILETRNDHLSGIEHPETGVQFIERSVELPNGELKVGTFPMFDSQFSIVLAEEIYLENDNTHFKIANETLYQAIQESPDIAIEMGLSPFDFQALANGFTPEGYTWHHNEQPGVLQLVNEDVHQNTGHTGGRGVWGGGSDYR